VRSTKSLKSESFGSNTLEILLKTFAATAITIFTVQMIRAGNRSEVFDKILVAGAVILSGVYACSVMIKKKKNPSLILSSIIVLGTSLLGIFSIEKHTFINGIDINKILWFGFGPFVGVASILLIPYIFKVYVGSAKSLVWGRRIVASIALLLLIPASWQGGSSLMEPDSPEYVINELLSVPSGQIPYVNFIPQYGILYTWLISPFTRYLGPDELVTLGLYLMSLGGLVAVFIGIWLTYRSMGSKSKSLAILLIVPFTSIAQFPGRESFSGSIFSTPTQVPVRILPGLVVGWLLITSVFTNKTKQKKICASIGFFLAGLSLWLNTDFGLALLLSVLLFTLIQSIQGKDIAPSSIFIVVGFLSYPFTLITAGKDFQWNDFATFIRQFGGGFGSEPIQTPGPVLFILPMIVSTFYASTLALLRSKFGKLALSSDQNRALVTSSFFSSWALIGFAYYLNRSYASGQMQILFLPLAIAMASLFYYLQSESEEKNMITLRSLFQSKNWNSLGRVSKSFSHVSLAIMMSLPIATVIAFPMPNVEIKRLVSAPQDHKWPLLKNESAFKDIEKLLSIPEVAESVAYFGSSSNYVKMKFGIESTNAFNSPFDLFMSQKMVNKGCEYVLASKKKFLVVNDTGATVAQNFQNGRLCDRFIPTSQFPTRLYQQP
jgi:hypothetical protein